MTRAGTLGWSFLGFLLVLASCLYITGRVTLYGPPPQLLEDLAQSRGLAGDTDGYSSPLSNLAGALPADPLWSSSALMVFVTVLTAAILFLGLGRVWKNAPSVVMACGFLFFNSEMWLLNSTPAEAVSGFLLAVTLCAILLGHTAFASAFLVALTVIDPVAGVMLFPAVLVVGFTVDTPRSVLILSLLLTPVALGILLSGKPLPGSGVEQWDGWVALPLAMLLVPRIRRHRAPLYLTLLAGSALSGGPQIAAAVALGDGTLALLQLCGASGREPETTDNRPLKRYSVRPLLHLLLLCVFIAAVLPGERLLNGDILIPSQKKRIPLATLFLPFSLEKHAAMWSEDSWRSLSPYPQLRAGDLEAVRRLTEEAGGGPFGVVTPDQLEESREVALVYALLTGRRVTGWSEEGRLYSPFLLSKRLGENVLVDVPLVMRTRGSVEIVAGASLPQKAHELDLRSLIPMPFKIQVVGESGGAYRWTWMGEQEREFVVAFKESPARVVFTNDAGKVRLTSLGPEKESREFILDAPSARLELRQALPTFPSRSLGTIAFSLRNSGSRPLSSEDITGFRLETTGVAPPADRYPAPTPLQPLDKAFILFPQEAVDLELVVVTPLTPDWAGLRASAQLSSGETLPLPIEGSTRFRTWPRFAPVGTWVEDG